MISLDRARPISDEILVAYLDHELADSDRAYIDAELERDPILRARHDYLSRASLPFAEAFSSVLSAAPSNLARKFPPLPPDFASRKPKGSHRLIDRRSIAAGLAAAMVLGPLGVLAGRLTRPDMNNWREAVAQYHKLYSDRTVAGIVAGRADGGQELVVVGNELGLELTLAWLEGIDARYRRSQILTVDGGPLAQIVLAGADEKVLAYCIRPLSGPDAAPMFESRAGLAVVHWRIGNFGFMIAGKASPAAVHQAGEILYRNARQKMSIALDS